MVRRLATAILALLLLAAAGWYGWQLGDGSARISRPEQQAATVRAIIDQLRRVAERRE